MNFAEFLRRRRTQLNIATAKDHFDALGGQKLLKISLRHFQQIESGKHPPSEQLFTRVFAKSPADDRRTLVIAYFNSVMSPDMEGREQLLSYLENHLTPGFETEKNSLWESGKPFITYSAEQLDYLVKHSDALQLHRRVLLFDQCDRKSCILPQKVLKEMEKLDLIETDRTTIRPSRTLYRLPHYSNSPSRLVAKATDLILKLQETYISREGGDDQELSYAMQVVTPAAAARIQEQMVAFKKWVQSMASGGSSEDLVPFLFVGFAKKIDRKLL